MDNPVQNLITNERLMINNDQMLNIYGELLAGYRYLAENGYYHNVNINNYKE